MKRRILLSALIAGAAMVSPLAQAETPIALKSVDVTLPGDKHELPRGPGVEAAQNHCLACHSAGMILVQPRMPRANWEAEVAKMRNVYKAPIDDKDVPAIVDYLTAIKGPK